MFNFVFLVKYAVNITLPVPPFPTHLFLHSSVLPLLIHHSVHPLHPLYFTPYLKPTCFTNPTAPRSFTSSSRTAFIDYCTDRFFWATPFLFLFFPNFSFLCRVLDKGGHFVSFWAQVNLPYRIISYRTDSSTCYVAFANVVTDLLFSMAFYMVNNVV